MINYNYENTKVGEIDMRKRQVVLYVVVMLALIATSVYATISADLKITIGANNKIYPGDNYTVTIGLDNKDQ